MRTVIFQNARFLDLTNILQTCGNTYSLKYNLLFKNKVSFRRLGDVLENRWRYKSLVKKYNDKGLGGGSLYIFKYWLCHEAKCHVWRCTLLGHVILVGFDGTQSRYLPVRHIIVIYTNLFNKITFLTVFFLYKFS